MEQFTILPIFVPILTIGILVSLPKKINQIPNNWQLINETFYYTILSLIRINSPKSIILLPLLSTIFYMILTSNLIGLIPYSTTASTEIVITLSLAICLSIGIFIYGCFINQSFIKTFYLFLPAGTPIFLLPFMIPLEILSYFTRTFSLGLRLAVNLITGHVLVKICLSLTFGSGLSPFALILPLLFLILFLSLEILIAYLQAYIFLFILIITLRDVIGGN